jgi:FkbM family methyltransferase
MIYLKKLIQRVLNGFGYQITRDLTKRHSLAGVLEQIKKLGFEPQTVIDAGVAHGTFELYETFPDATHLLVEPLVEFEDVLKDISSQFSKVEYVIAAASSKQGTIRFTVRDDLTLSSSLDETDGSHINGTLREVSKTTIDNLCHEKRLSGPYLIKIDVQGAELDVLDGAKKVLAESELVVLEVSLFQLFVDGPQFYDVVNYMKERQFVVYDIFGWHTRLLDEALAQVDLAFVKENGQFRRHHRYRPIG